MKLFDRKIKIDDEEFWLTINKKYYSHVTGTTYYNYDCVLYKEVKSLFGTKKKAIYSYETYWLDYPKYRGDLDEVIDEVIRYYKREKKEQKYISDNELNFKSKYEV